MQDKNLITLYRDFIISLIKIPKTVNVIQRVKDSKGNYQIYHVKIGLPAKIDVDVKLSEIYSRSIKVDLKFDKYHKEYIYYISRHNSPAKQLELFDNKLYDMVNNTLIENEEWELMDKLHKESTDKISKFFKI